MMHMARSRKGSAKLSDGLVLLPAVAMVFAMLFGRAVFAVLALSRMW